MLTTITGLLLFGALVCSVGTLAGKVPAGLAPLLLSIAGLLSYLPAA